MLMKMYKKLLIVKILELDKENKEIEDII